MLEQPPFWSLHTHSKYSVNDALPSVDAIVAKAAALDYPALGLTDHGSMSGSIELYSACRKSGIEPLPGIELYVVPDSEYAGRGDNLHLTVVAYTERGYRNLVQLATLTQKRFWYRPRIDFADFAAMSEDGATQGLAVATGCFFGVLPQVLMAQGHTAAVQVAQTLAGWFPRVYVEMQNHGIDLHANHVDSEFTDDELVDAVWQVAQTAGLPVVVTRDSHYIDESERWLHDGLKRLVSWSDDVDDAVFPGGGYHMTGVEGLREYFGPKHLSAGLEGLRDLAEAACVRLPEMETFSMKVPDVTFGKDPQRILEQKVHAALGTFYPAGQRKADPRPALDLVDYSGVAAAELETISKAGMASYVLLVDQVCEFMRDKGISYHARGSAGGSLVMRLLGVTQVDPIRFGLRFDRFLSADRTRPPDVDLDVEHTRRDEVVAWLGSKWAIRQVGSHMKYAIFDEEEGDESSGSLRVRYYSTRKKQGKPSIPWRDLPAEDKKLLNALGGLKLISGYGTHAAGYIVAPDEQVLEQLPLAYIASSMRFVTAYGKKPVEKLGFLKLDLLGLRTRTAIRIATELAGVDFDEIPDNDKDTMRRIAQGRVIGAFQLEGVAMLRGVQDLKPTKLEDIIAAQALFRPAAMHAGATADFKARRAGRDVIPRRHADITEATNETFGVLLYQEQVMAVLRTLGLSADELTNMLDAIKASNEYTEGARVVIDAEMPKIRALAAERHWTELDVDWLVSAIEAYADYGFNKAHAAQYGVISYRTAYMLTHHPVEYWTGMLTAYDDHEKEASYVSAARRDGVVILPPHVNRSQITYALDPHTRAIRKGLISVKGVGKVSATELVSKAPYTSLTDLGQRVLPRRVGGAKGLALKKRPSECGGVIAALSDVDALDGLPINDPEEPE